MEDPDAKGSLEYIKADRPTDDIRVVSVGKIPEKLSRMFGTEY